MIVTILAISILGFIVLHFYTDYSNWANTGNTFAEGFTGQKDPQNDKSYSCSSGGTFATYNDSTLTQAQKATASRLYPGKPASYYACVQGCSGTCSPMTDGVMKGVEESNTQNNYEYVQKRYCATYDGYTRHNVPVSASQSKEKGCQMKCDEEGENCNTIAVGDGVYGGNAYNCTTYKNCALSAPGTSSNWTRGSGTTGGNYEYYKKNAAQNQYDEEVKKAYREILGREPDPGGLNHYKTLLQNGTTVAQMRSFLENSDEAKNRRNSSSTQPIKYTTMTKLSDFCGDGNNETTKMEWEGQDCGDGKIKWMSMKSTEGRRPGYSLDQCSWTRGNNSNWNNTYVGDCGVSPTYINLPTNVSQISQQQSSNVSQGQECAANYGSTTPSDGSNSGTVAAKYVCPQDRPLCKDYKFGVKWGNCESATINPTIGVAQPVQGAIQGGMEHQQQMPQQMPQQMVQQIPQQQPPMGQQMIQQMPQQQPEAQQQGSMAQGSPVAVTSNFARPTDFTLFNEQILQQVLANKNLIPEDIPLNAEDQASLIRVGKSFMLDVAKIRNLVLPNIKQNDYEILGRIVSKHLKDKEDGATRAHLDVTKSRIMNTVQALLSSTELNSSIVHNGTTPSVTTSNRTTGMMSDKTNAHMTGKGNYDFAKGMNGMSGKYTDSYKPTNDTINPKPYDSVWSVFY